MSKKPAASPDKPSEIPPPPATGGTHVWSDTLGIWETTDATIQPWDERHPDNRAPKRSAAAGAGEEATPVVPAEQPFKDA